MFKKILSISSIFAISLSTFAGSFYFGPAATYVNLKSNDANFSGVSPAIYAGYGTWARNWLYLAGEIFAAAKAININHDDEDTDSILKQGTSYGISVVPAVILDNTLIGFARLGYVKTDFPNLDADEGAYQIGVGVEGVIAECWSLRGEYVYTPYTSVQGVGTIRSNQVTVSLIYRFESLIGGGIGFFEE